MTDKKDTDPKEDLQQFEENPYSPDNKKPEDIVRLFYAYDLPIVPVVSKRGILIGILRKEDVISELSDIERTKSRKIDEFVTDLARRMTFDDLLKYGSIREFKVVNIFGDVQGDWTRLQLFSAVENRGVVEKTESAENVKAEIQDQKEEQILEWIIYLILEHIPKPLYAINEKGKTIFYNSFFEDLYEKKFNGKEVDPVLVEKFLKNPDFNEPRKNGSDLHFYNKELDVLYEKVPLKNKKKRIGFLFYCEQKTEEISNPLSSVFHEGMALSEAMYAVERSLIVDAVKKSENPADAARILGISRQGLASRIKKFNLDLNP